LDDFHVNGLDGCSELSLQEPKTEINCVDRMGGTALEVYLIAASFE
jgi:hypothetical protein